MLGWALPDRAFPSDRGTSYADLPLTTCEDSPPWWGGGGYAALCGEFVHSRQRGSVEEVGQRPVGFAQRLDRELDPRLAGGDRQPVAAHRTDDA